VSRARPVSEQILPTVPILPPSAQKEKPTAPAPCANKFHAVNFADEAGQNADEECQK
jgi:hypothetical protein